MQILRYTLSYHAWSWCIAKIFKFQLLQDWKTFFTCPPVLVIASTVSGNLWLTVRWTSGAARRGTGANGAGHDIVPFAVDRAGIFPCRCISANAEKVVTVSQDLVNMYQFMCILLNIEDIPIGWRIILLHQQVHTAFNFSTLISYPPNPTDSSSGVQDEKKAGKFHVIIQHHRHLHIICPRIRTLPERGCSTCCDATLPEKAPTVLFPFLGRVEAEVGRYWKMFNKRSSLT